MPYHTLSSEYISDHRYFRARRDCYETPSGKIVDPYFVVEIPPAAAALAITSDNEVILVQQYRHPMQSLSIELPGGFIDPGEDPELAIRRELREETGYDFNEFIYLGDTWANPGVLNNKTHLFIAKGGIKSGEQQPDPNEEIELIFKSIEEVKQMLHANEFRQSMHSLLLYRAFQQL